MSTGVIPILTNFSQTNATSYVTASGSSSLGALQLFGVLSDMSAATPPAPTLTHSGALTWTQVATVSYNTIATARSTLTLFRALHSAATSGTVTIDFGASTQINCIWAWAEFVGVDPSGTNGAGAIVQSVTNRADGAVGAFAVTLGAGASSRNAVFGLNGQDKGTLQSTTAGTGFDEIHNRAQSTEVNRVETEWRRDFTTNVDWTFSTTLDTAGIAVELKLLPSMLAMVGAG